MPHHVVGPAVGPQVPGNGGAGVREGIVEIVLRPAQLIGQEHQLEVHQVIDDDRIGVLKSIPGPDQIRGHTVLVETVVQNVRAPEDRVFGEIAVGPTGVGDVVVGQPSFADRIEDDKTDIMVAHGSGSQRRRPVLRALLPDRAPGLLREQPELPRPETGVPRLATGGRPGTGGRAAGDRADPRPGRRVRERRHRVGGARLGHRPSGGEVVAQVGPDGTGAGKAQQNHKKGTQG